MREIKFRGKRKNNGEWVYGYLVNSNRYGNYRTQAFIIPIDNNYGYTDSPVRLYFSDPIEIDPKTVGLFTGLFDKNGEEIYEGDILEFITKRKYGFLYDGVKVRIKVEFGKFNPMNDTLYDFIGFHTNDSSIQYYLEYGCEVVGNVHDNPELLK